MKKLIFAVVVILVFAVLVVSSWGKLRIGGGFVMGENWFTVVAAEPEAAWTAWGTWEK